jgi:hypothetical protein
MEKPLDEALSIELAQRITKAKDNFENTYKAALATEEAIYVQGFLVFAGKPYKPIEHSWLETSDRILDPAFPHLHKKAEELYYFPAQRLTIKQLKAAIEEAEEDYPDDDPLPIYGNTPYEYYGDVMLGGQEYLDAFNAAEAKSRELNKPEIN